VLARTVADSCWQHSCNVTVAVELCPMSITYDHARWCYMDLKISSRRQCCATSAQSLSCATESLLGASQHQLADVSLHTSKHVAAVSRTYNQSQYHRVSLIYTEYQPRVYAHKAFQLFTFACCQHTAYLSAQSRSQEQHKHTSNSVRLSVDTPADTCMRAVQATRLTYLQAVATHNSVQTANQLLHGPKQRAVLAAKDLTVTSGRDTSQLHASKTPHAARHKSMRKPTQPGSTTTAVVAKQHATP
jgi:hypothetical protein